MSEMGLFGQAIRAFRPNHHAFRNFPRWGLRSKRKAPAENPAGSGKDDSGR